MKKQLLIALLAAVVACGGGKKKTAKPSDKKAEPEAKAEPEMKKEKEEPAEEKAPPPPPAPKVWHAKAALNPTKGSKVVPATISFSQEEGKETQVSSEGAFTGLAKGSYDLVIHEGGECGTDAKKAGKAWAGGSDAKLMLKAGADKKASLEQTETKLSLDGDSSIVGKTLALHLDAKGKPGKVLACGAIEKAGEGSEAEEKGESKDEEKAEEKSEKSEKTEKKATAKKKATKSDE
jgi:copper/zinc superoxide dismutase (SODC)